MNNPPLNKGNTRNTIEMTQNKRFYNNIPNENIKGYRPNERKGISLTPDRRIQQSNSNREIINNYSNQKYNPRLLERNASAKKTDFNRLNDNGNPKEKYSQKEISQISINQDYSTISKFSNKSMVQTYLDRRHLETQQKINKLRHEKLTQESSELRFKPLISENSKKIIKNLISKEKAVKVVDSTIMTNTENRLYYEKNSENALNKNNLNDYNYHNNNTYTIQKSPIRAKYSQLDDYKKIAEQRENLNNTYDRHTIDVIFF